MSSPNVIEINDEQAQKAKILSSSMSESELRKSAMIDILGISCAVQYLNSKNIKAQTQSSVYKIPLLFEEFKICDIYYNNYRIDVITLYDDDMIRVLKRHADDYIMPNFYVIVQIDPKIKKAEILGFMDAQKVIKSSHDTKYYYPERDLIYDFEVFRNLTSRPLPEKPVQGRHSDCLGLFLRFLDGDLSSLYKKRMIQHLLTCDSCKKAFCNMTEFEKVSSYAVNYPDLAEKYSGKGLPVKLSEMDLKDDNDENNDYQKKPDIKIKVSNNSEYKDLVDAEVAKEFQKEAQKELENAQEENTAKKEANVIEKIFDNAINLDDFSIPSAKIFTRSKKRMLIAGLALFALLSFAVISVQYIVGIPNNAKNNAQDNGEYDEVYDYYDEDYDSEYDTAPSQARLIAKHSGGSVEDFIIQQPVNTKPAYSPTVANVSWEAPQSLVKKEIYTKFLQLTGKNIKLNLQNDLLLIKDVPVNKLAKLDIRIASNGDVRHIKVAKSSGSAAIDALLKKVVSNTLKYMKPPSHGIISRSIDITLVVELY